MDEQVQAKILETLGRLDERTERLEKELIGNGQPGLKQRVESLESTRAWGKGIASAGGFVLTMVEYLLHRK